MSLRARHFGQGCADQHRDGDDERGEALGVAVIVVGVGIEGGTFVLLYLHWPLLPSPWPSGPVRVRPSASVGRGHRDIMTGRRPRGREGGRAET